MAGFDDQRAVVRVEGGMGAGDQVMSPPGHPQIRFVKPIIAVDAGIKFSQRIRIASHGTAENQPISKVSQDRAVIQFDFHVCPVL